jgi:hypothetical protein
MATSACEDRPAALEKSSSCSAGWQPLNAPQPYDVVSTLAYQGGMLYYATRSTGTLNSLPATGGVSSVLSPTFGRELWVEGDQLLFTQGELNNQVFSLPLSGGTPQLLLDGGAGRLDAGVALLHVVTPTDVFWTEVSLATFGDPTTVWRAPRAAGLPVMIGKVTAQVPRSTNVLGYQGMALGDDAVLLESILGIADAVPFDGGAVRALAAPAASDGAGVEPSGIDPSGAYWSVLRPGVTDDTWALDLSPADGGPSRHFWPGRPHSYISYIWPDGQGGWVMVGAQLFDDQRFHATVWLLDPQRNARLLACSPGSSDEFWITSPVAMAPDAIFAVAQNLATSTWEIDRIAR